MAYIPPHKRHSKDSSNTPSPSLSPSPSPTPSLYAQQHHRNKPNPRQPNFKILYAKGAVDKWFVVPFNDPCSVQLKEFPHEQLERKDGAKPVILVSQDHHPHKEEVNKAPWASIEEKIRQDLLNSFQIARAEMCKDGPDLNLPKFVMRFGKVLFLGVHGVSLDGVKETSDVQSILSRFKQIYYTNVPDSFIQAMVTEVVPKIGLDFHNENDYYHVKVFDKVRPHSTISCKCGLTKDAGELDIFKIELNEVRRLVVDISCLDKNLDLRLLLSSKRILAILTDDEKHSLTNLVKSAIIDSEVKGGLRWPLGKESLGDRYTVVGIWHIKSKTFKTSYAKLKVRHADRFDFRTSTGEVSQEASLWIPELKKQLRDETLELHPLVGMVSETLKLVWEHFLSWEGSFI